MAKTKVLVVSSKGGVGKSTVSMQVVAPYLFEKNSSKPVSFYEFDDENIDSLSYGGSQISNRESIEVEEYVIMDKLLEILSSDEYTCIDVGGNKSTTLCLDTLNDTGMINQIDLAIIPLLDGEQDAINAKKVYRRLKELDPTVKVVFALNRVKSIKYVQYQFDNFFGDVRGIFSDEDALIHILEDEEKENFISIEDSDVIKYSRKFGMTIYEIAAQDRDFVSELKSADNEKDKKLIAFKNTVYQNAKKYYDSNLKENFAKLDDILKG